MIKINNMTHPLTDLIYNNEETGLIIPQLKAQMEALQVYFDNEYEDMALIIHSHQYQTLEFSIIQGYLENLNIYPIIDSNEHFTQWDLTNYTINGAEA